jgi:hypothetical protein
MSKGTKISKTKIDTFISKYFLGGLARSVVWTFKGKKLTTEFISDTRSMKGFVTYKECSYPEEFSMGIFDTEKLTKLISVLDDECTLAIDVVNGEAKTAKFNDGNVEAVFMLSSLDMIPPVPRTKELPKMDIGIKITKEFIERFIRAANALSEVGTVTVSHDKNGAKFTIGYSTVAANNITLYAECSFAHGNITQMTFPSNVYAQIFAANKEATKMNFEISEQGLSALEFESPEYSSTYYVISTQEAK